VECEEAGSSSNHPELAALVLALRGTPVTKPMLYLCDNQALLKVVKKMDRRRQKTDVGRSAKRRHFTGEAIKELQKRTTAGAATFLVKVKAHRGEPANEEADIQANKSILIKDVSTE